MPSMQADILNELHAAGVPLYAITNFSGEKFRETRARFPFLARFRDIIVSGDEGLLKPGPEIFRLLLDRHGLAAGDCLFIDDSWANVEGAETVGFKAHHFTSPEDLRRALARHGLGRNRGRAPDAGARFSA
jgi:2-haloacid dehalogenase